MAKKHTTKRAPTKPPKATGGGGAKKRKDEPVLMESGGEKNSAIGDEELDFRQRHGKKHPPELPDYWMANEEPNSYAEVLRQQGINIATFERELIGAVGELQSVAIDTIIKLRRIERDSNSRGKRLAAGRALADVTTLFLAYWPNDAHNSMSRVLQELYDHSAGFKDRWTKELHVKNRRPPEGNDVHYRHFIIEMEALASWSCASSVIAEIKNAHNKKPIPANGRQKRLLEFISKIGLTNKIKESPAAKQMLDLAKRIHFEDYWRIVIDPLARRSWKEWAENKTFSLPAERSGMTPDEKNKLKDWKPFFANVSGNMQTHLKAWLEGSTTHEHWL